MSAIRSGPPLPALPPVGETGRARQAQSAFFRAALDQAAPGPASGQASAPVRSQPAIAAAPTPVTAPSTTPAPALRPVQTTQAAPEPTRVLRPGSLLDIRI